MFLWQYYRLSAGVANWRTAISPLGECRAGVNHFTDQCYTFFCEWSVICAVIFSEYNVQSSLNRIPVHNVANCPSYSEYGWLEHARIAQCHHINERIILCYLVGSWSALNGITGKLYCFFNFSLNKIPVVWRLGDYPFNKPGAQASNCRKCTNIFNMDS